MLTSVSVLGMIVPDYVYSELHYSINQKMPSTSGSKTDQPTFRRSGRRPTGPKPEASDPFPSQMCSSGPQRAPEHTSSSSSTHADWTSVYLVFLSCCVGSPLSCGIPDLLRLFLQTAAAAATEARPVTETRAGRSRGLCTASSSRAEFEQRCCGRTQLRRCSREVNTESASSAQMVQDVCVTADSQG